MPIHETDQGWVLETHTTGYALGINHAGLLVHRYWGGKLTQLDDYPLALSPDPWASFNAAAQRTPEEYPGYEGAKYIEPCLKVTFADGVRDVVLRFDRAEVQLVAVPELRVLGHDTFYPFAATLHYRVHEAYDLIERFVTITNQGDEPVTIERIWSAQWHLLLHDTYRLTHVTGRWFDEMYLRRSSLVQGIKVLESRRLTTSHHHSPWFAVDRGSSHEDAGEV